MKIIQVHNYYQIKGGEATVVEAEKKILLSNGHEVIPFYKHNAEIDSYSILKKVSLLKQTTWSNESHTEFLSVLRKEKPDVCHVHNFLPLISPSIYLACQKMGVPVVQTLHNYRLICTNGLLLREGKVCEDCLGKSAYGAVRKKCYRNSQIQTYAIARMLEKNKKWGTWSKHIDAFICLTGFAKEKFIQHGLPADKLMVKSNFIAHGPHPLKESNVPYFIFVGRLTESKGVKLLKKIANESPLPIVMVGEGDLEPELKGIQNLRMVGKKTHEETLELIGRAEALILPSLWYEGMPMTIVEAFSLKTVVVASEIGAMQSMIQHEQNGLLFSPNNKQDLLKNLNFVLVEKGQAQEIAENAFQNYLEQYSPESNYTKLMQIYSSVIQNKA